MKIINRARRSGKTLMLINSSYINDIPILVKDECRAQLIRKQANELGLLIRVFTLSDWIRSNAHFEKVYIDEAKDIIETALSAYLKTNIVACTFSIPMTEIKDINGGKDNE